MPLLSLLLLYLMELVRSGWTMSSVVELSPDSLTVLQIHWVATTVFMLKMPVLTALVSLPPYHIDIVQFPFTVTTILHSRISRKLTTNILKDT